MNPSKLRGFETKTVIAAAKRKWEREKKRPFYLRCGNKDATQPQSPFSSLSLTQDTVHRPMPTKKSDLKIN